MKFKIKKIFLLQPLQKLNSIITINNEYPITSNIIFKLRKDYIFLISTNIELEFITKIQLLGYNYHKDMSISGKKLLNIIRSFPNEADIVFMIKNNIMKITYKNIFFSLNISQTYDFPKFIKEKNTIDIICEQKKFKNILYNTAFSMAKQDIRHYLNGILIEIKKNKIFSVSTDGYRMSICNTNIQYTNKLLSIIIPRKTIIELMKILKEKKDLFTFSIGLKMVQFRINEYIISSKLIDNEFPNYKNLFIQEFHQTIQINRKLLQQALNRATIVTNKKFPGVKLSLNNTKCILSAKNENNEMIIEEIKIENINTVIELTMNINYILDIVHVINNENITFFLNKNISSIYIQHIEEYHSFYIIMPLII